MNTGNQNGTFTLPDSGRLIMPFDIEAAISSLPVFCASPGQASVIDTVLEFLVQDGYQLIMRACPSTLQQGASNDVLGYQTYEDQISVPAGSFLTMLGAITNQTEGFRFKLYDAGAQADLSDGFIHSNCMTGRFTQLPQTTIGMLTSLTSNKNLFILPSPLSITSPGQLNVQITNLSASTARIDMAFYFATFVGHYANVASARVANSVSR